LPRDLPLGNEHLLISFDSDYLIRDIYYPHIGRENHSVGHKFRLGVWVNGVFSWIDSQGWVKSLSYEEDTLVSDVTMQNEALGIKLHFRDAVDFVVDALLRCVTVERTGKGEAEARLFFHQDFHLYGNDIGDTAFYDPQLNAVIHYKDRRYFLTDAGTEADCCIFQYACGQKEMPGREGTWRDAEDGLLSGNAISQGSVDSVVSISFHLKEGESQKGYYYIAAGEDYDSIDRLQSLIRSRAVENLIQRTSSYWKLWSNKERLDFLDMPENLSVLYRRSLLSMMTNIDVEGGIIAANDTDLLRFNRDTYSYVWPRDGALIAMALDNAGYYEVASRFFNFCLKVISHRGYFLQKYNPDGSFASSWHPWMLNGKASLPIQEDETALVVYALWNHFNRYRDVEFVKPLYRPLVKNAADFLSSYVNPDTGLPLDSYDLWEERRGVFTFTTAAVYAGLQAASSFCRSFGEISIAEHYSSVAETMKSSMCRHLFDNGRFIRGFLFDGKACTIKDSALDASLAGVFHFGVLEASDEMVRGTMEAIEKELWVRGPIGGICRYAGDWYQRSDANRDYQGNPWFICTLWLADWYIDVAQNQQQLERGLSLLQWCSKHALPSGILAEQIDPSTGAPLSVSPLTWSHAAYVDSFSRYLKKKKEIGTG